MCDSQSIKSINPLVMSSGTRKLINVGDLEGVIYYVPQYSTAGSTTQVLRTTVILVQHATAAAIIIPKPETV